MKIKNEMITEIRNELKDYKKSFNLSSISIVREKQDENIYVVSVFPIRLRYTNLKILLDEITQELWYVIKKAKMTHELEKYPAFIGSWIFKKNKFTISFVITKTEE